jgi:uncharacterized membrane protein
MAVLAHVLRLIGGWIAPLVIFLVKRQSRFISFHALQVLLFEGVVILLTMIGMTVVFAAMAISFALGGFQHKPSGPPVFFFLSFGIVWLGIMASWIVKLILAIVYGARPVEANGRNIRCWVSGRGTFCISAQAGQRSALSWTRIPTSRKNREKWGTHLVAFQR